MSKDLKEQFISEITGDLDAEQEILLTKELESLVDAEHPNLENAVKSLQTKKHRKHSVGRWVLIGCLLAACITIFTARSTNLIGMYKSFGSIFSSFDIFDYQTPPIPFDYTEEERLLAESSTDSQSAKKLWESEPENLGYLTNHLTQSEELSDLISYDENSGTYEPNEIYKKAELLDPNNSLYAFLASASLKDSIERNMNYENIESDIKDLEYAEEKSPLSVTDKTKLDTLRLEILSEKRFNIIDEKKFQLATILLEKGLAKPILKKQIDYYQLEFTSFAAKKTNLNDIHSLMEYISYAGQVKSIWEFLSAHDLYCAHLANVCEEGDNEKVKWLIERYVNFLDQHIESNSTIIESLLSQALLNNSIHSMMRASIMIEWKEMIYKLEKFESALNKHKAQVEQNTKVITKKNTLGALHSVTESIANHSAIPISITDNERDQSRYTMHAFLGRIISILLFVILGIVLFLSWLFRFIRISKMNSSITKLNHLIKIKDWILLILISVVLPLILFWFVIHSQAFGTRTWNVSTSDGVPFIGQYISLLCIIIGLAVCSIRYLLAKNLPIELKQFKRLHITMTVWSIITLLALGLWCEKIGSARDTMIGIGLIPLCYWLLAGCMFFFKKVSFQKYLINRTIIPVLGVAMLGMILFAFSLHQVEKHWFAKDTLFSIDQKTGWMKLESEVTEQRKIEFAKILEILK